MDRVVMTLLIIGAALLPGLVSAPAVAQGGEDHCVAVDAAFLGCYTSEGEARSVADNYVAELNSINVAADDPAVALAAVLGIAYDNINYGGASFTFTTANNAGCTAGASYGYPRLSDYGWDNRFESIRTYVGCISQLFDTAFYSGTRTDCVNCTTLGFNNNAASGVRFVPGAL